MLREHISQPDLHETVDELPLAETVLVYDGHDVDAALVGGGQLELHPLAVHRLIAGEEDEAARGLSFSDMRGAEPHEQNAIISLALTHSLSSGFEMVVKLSTSKKPVRLNKASR